MPVYRDKRNGRYFVQFDYLKQTYKFYLPKDSTRTKAARLETKKRSELFDQAHGLAPRQDEVFEDFVKEIYLPYVKANHSKDSFDQSDNICCEALPFLRGRSLRSIKAQDIEAFKAYRQSLPTQHGTPRKPSTIWRELSILSKVFSLAVKNDLCEYNPCSRVERPSFDNIQDKILAYEDEEAFFAAFENETARDICALILHVGLSRKDVFSLTDFNINRHTRTLTLTRSKTKRHGDIPLNESAWGVIEPRLGKGLLFVSDKTGGPLTSIRTAINGACRRAEIPRLTIRDLRRTFGSRLEGDDVSKARLLCHADTRMLVRYSRRTDRLRDMVENLDNPTPILRKVKTQSDK